MKVSIETINGAKYITIDGKVIDTLSFKSFRPTKNNVGDFYNAGVKIHQLFVSGLPSKLKIPYSTYGETWFGEGDYRFKGFDKQMEMFMEAAPDAYLFVNLHVDSRTWWHEQNPGRPNSFSHTSQIAADEKWRKDTADYIKALMTYAEEKYGDRIIGYFLLGGSATEWLSMFDYQETHPIKLEAYRKYMNDESAEIPSREELEGKPEEMIFLDPVADKNIIDYQKFHADLMVETVMHFCRESQKVLKHEKLLGVYFGYVMECGWVWEFGHLALDKLYRSGDVNLLATPSSYQFRDYNDSSAHMLISDTVELNNMVYFISFDHMTHLAPTLYNNPRRICEDKDDERGLPTLISFRQDESSLTTREKTIHAIQREFMSRAAKRMGMWWFDMLEGWYYDDGLMDAVKNIVAKSGELAKVDRKSSSEIAVFVSTDSLYYVNKMSRINASVIKIQRGALARIGAPYDIYSFNDIGRIDASGYKMIVFLNAYYMTDEQRECVNRLKSDGRSLLFIGAADYINDDGCSETRMEEMLGMKLSLAENPETKIGAEGTLYGYEKPKTPIWYVDDETTEILGRYNNCRKAGLASKSFGNYKIYFSGLGNVSAGVFRKIALEAGVHIYAYNDTPTYINFGVFGVYNTKSEFTEITMKHDGEFKELFSGRIYKTINKKINLPTGENPAQMLIKID